MTTTTEVPTRLRDPGEQRDLDQISWVEMLGRIRFGSMPAAARKHLDAFTIKGVAFHLAGYADRTGGGIHAAEARVAVEAEIAYDSAAEAMELLLGLGLIRLVDEEQYQLAVDPALLHKHRVRVWSPAQFAAAAGGTGTTRARVD